MADKFIGKLVQVNSTMARNPGGYGRVIRKHRKMYRVDSSAYPSQEVSGWYTKAELVVLDSEPTQAEIERLARLMQPEAQEVQA